MKNIIWKEEKGGGYYAFESKRRPCRNTVEGTHLIGTPIKKHGIYMNEIKGVVKSGFTLDDETWISFESVSGM